MSIRATLDALMRTCLQSPGDGTPRSILADWLEEEGSPANAAWAGYLRAKLDKDRHHPASREAKRFRAIAAQLSEFVQARLTVSAASVVGTGKSFLPFLRILPAPNITIELGDTELPLPSIELVPESVAREGVVIPVESRDRVLLVVAAEPHPDLVDKLNFILNREIAAFRGGFDDIAAAINRHYGQSETESIDSVSYESPLIGLQGDTREIFVIFHRAFSTGATGFEMRREADHGTIRYLHPGVSSETERCSVRTYDRLLAHCLAEASGPAYRAYDLECLDFDVPLLSGRRFPVTFQRQHNGRPDWFRLRFCWERREPSR